MIRLEETGRTDIRDIPNRGQCAIAGCPNEAQHCRTHIVNDHLGTDGYLCQDHYDYYECPHTLRYIGEMLKVPYNTLVKYAREGKIEASQEGKGRPWISTVAAVKNSL